MGCSICQQKKLRKQNGLPSTLSMIQNLAFTFLNVTKTAITTGRIVADKVIIEKRITTCRSCPHLIGGKRCTICGCFVVAKAGLQSEQCPKGLW
jgi:hypothetical protein